MVVIFLILNFLIFGFGYFSGIKYAINQCTEVTREIRNNLSPEARTEFDEVVKVIYEKEGK